MAEEVSYIHPNSVALYTPTDTLGKVARANVVKDLTSAFYPLPTPTVLLQIAYYESHVFSLRFELYSSMKKKLKFSVI